MNQELLIRLFRSIEGDKNDDVVRVAELIINDEKRKGHERLAEKLTSILKKNVSTTEQFRGELKQLLPKGITVPTDKRNNLPLAIFVDRDELRHHMVLRPETESKIFRIEQEYAAKERLALHGLKYRQKILLYGAPGCGKSMSAERIAWNLGLPFLKVRFDVIISSFLGETAFNLAKLFEGIKNYPCVLLFDEFDVIAKTRTNSQDIGEMHRVVNILLTLLEEYDAPGIFIATTNIENALDSALFRRFDDIVEMPKPTCDEITKLLTLTLSSMQKSKDLNMDEIARRLEGFSAAIVVKIANDAAKFSIIENEKEVRNHHFDKSFNENQFYIK